jgi:hypothetical protein
MTIARGIVAIAGDAVPLTKNRESFNKLVAKLAAQREELGEWRAFRQTYRDLLAAEYEPLAARLREKRIALAMLFDRTLGNEALGRRDEHRLREILRELLAELLLETEDPSLIRLHDKYADVSFDELRARRMACLRSLAGEALDVDVEDYTGADSPEEFSDWLEERAKSARAERAEPGSEDAGAPPRERSHRARRRLETGRQAVREIFRKLASELHPDRESDPEERTRKTALMQQANYAYKAQDLLALLELQQSLAHVDAAAPAGIAEDRLKRYVRVLEDQSRRLTAELREFVAPFAAAVGGSPSRKLTPEAVRRALSADVLKMRGMVRGVEADLLRFRDLRLLKQSLRNAD